MLRDIFYSIDENILFYVAGYTDNSDRIEDIRKTLEEGEKFIRDLLFGIDIKDIKTLYVTNSSRYKYMRVFYVHTKLRPASALVIGDSYTEHADGTKTRNEWTMMSWLTN